jgi:hypothetical protein|tara:strand:+ start:608 stop:751 length:144 start_codon:yes stop_codon:yes gene_type:complete
MKLGDAVEYGIKKTGLDKLAPKDCGCTQRKEKLNNFGSNVMSKIFKK